jgi:hypothetical protein
VMACKFNAAMKMSYRILDEKLASQLEVTSGHMNMNFEVDQTMPAGQGGQADMNMVMKGKGGFDLKAVDLDGQPHLISGTQDINMKMIMPVPSQGQQSVPQLFGGMKEELRYLHQASGVESFLRATLTMNGNNANENYSVDGVSVTAEAYVSERDKFANSMMAFGKQESANGSSDTQQPTHPQPPTNPIPQPTSQPFPQPPTQPVPQPPTQPNPPTNPQPLPPSTDRKWVCVVENYSNKDVFVGYGSVEFVARSKAKQACQNTAGNSCSSLEECEQQDPNPNAWYCQTKNYATNRIFDGTGGSKTEAGYNARKACFLASGNSSSGCQTVYGSDCTRQ